MILGEERKRKWKRSMLSYWVIGDMKKGSATSVKSNYIGQKVQTETPENCMNQFSGVLYPFTDW